MTGISNNASKVIKFLQENPTVDLIDRELSDIVGIPGRSITGVINGLVRNGYASRDRVSVGDEEKNFVRLTEKGLDVDLEE